MHPKPYAEERPPYNASSNHTEHIIEFRPIMTRTMACSEKKPWMHTDKPMEFQILNVHEIAGVTAPSESSQEWRQFAAGCTAFFSLVGGSKENQEPNHTIRDFIHEIHSYCRHNWRTTASAACREQEEERMGRCGCCRVH
jgi:hypothetical protein